LDTARQAAAAHRSGCATLALGHPGFAGHEFAVDMVLAAPFAWPRYIQNAFPI
jgi:hypothetical protein